MASAATSTLRVSLRASKTRKMSTPLSADARHEVADDVVAVMAVADQVLSAQQHLQRRLGAMLLDGAQALPGIFVQKTDAGVEGGAAP